MAGVKARRRETARTATTPASQKPEPQQEKRKEEASDREVSGGGNGGSRVDRMAQWTSYQVASNSNIHHEWADTGAGSNIQEGLPPTRRLPCLLPVQL